MNPAIDSLVLYKGRPARVLSVGEKVQIELEREKTKSVRPKDVQILHPGPLYSLNELTTLGGEIEEAWNLLQGENTSLAELAELIYSDFTPITAWATWQMVADGLFFSGNPESIQVRDRDTVEHDRRERAEREAAKREWASFIARLKQNKFLTTDRDRLQEVERVALGQAEHSRILEALGLPVNKDAAHRLLLTLGYWPPYYNPYPARFRISLEGLPDVLPPLPEEPRVDLTHLSAYAIDNEGNQDPDDALSIDGELLWVHVADVAALVSPDTELDQEARGRGANLYIPEGIIPILPDPITRTLGLGLQPLSPALSFGMRLGTGTDIEIEICRSWVRVQRVSYQAVEQRLHEEPFSSLLRITAAFHAQREARGCSTLNFPEVDIDLVDGMVHIRPLERLRSRELVTDAMLMAGAAVGSYCQRLAIPIPYVIQSPPDKPQTPDNLAAMWAYRKQLKPSRLSVEPGPHSGLGLNIYTRATSPLRRYSDLLVHQQLRAHLAGRELLTATQIAERFDLAEIGGITTRRAERLSNNHWKLVWLLQHPHWQGEAIVVEQDQDRLLTLIPELALETRVRVSGGAPLNARLQLKLREIDLPALTCYFEARLKP